MLELPAELEDEFAELQFALDNTENGGWFFCVYKQAIVRDELIARLKTDCQLPIFHWHYDSEKSAYPIDYLKNLSASQQENRAIVFFLNVTTGGDKVIKSLDFNREKFSEYPHCLVFFVTELELKDVAIKAGHFWAQRRGRFDFSEFFVRETENEKIISIRNDSSILKIENHKEAEKQLNFYLDELEKNKEKESILLVETYDKIGYLFNFLGKNQDSMIYLEKSLSIYEKFLGENHPNTGIKLNNLASLYRDQGRYNEALSLYQRCLIIFETQLGENHLATATCLNNLAELYESQGNIKEAESFYLRALAIRAHHNHPTIATSLNDLAGLYKKQGRYDESLLFYQRALAILKQNFGENHFYTAGSLNNLATLYESQGRYIEAQLLYQQALTILKKSLGETHPNTKLAQINCDNLLKKLNNP